ncbi:MULTISPECIES: DNA polymerase III subunit alpha [unclassified Nocardioides]|uniref:DNA polymerase III subunit alpha n=1 Tax=unclassified Nocardioides TaxID=2615069 RepID=UPI0007023062|nr:MULTISPECIES: DNA polymerase III subunit alpha [unclassified Nocardioides]KQY63977.1 DNA polymerase III subunit alpha [Nocardioides sp. Root140]KRF15991.1 DNA polymerase III subunit alpha [Nocardioides sp. Soil796]
MPDPFVHLHVASGYSLQYGASHPHVLVERAVEQEMDTLALTDRDGTYGAVRFVKACQRAGVRPVLGVDLAYAASWSPGFEMVPEGVAQHPSRPAGSSRTPVRGGAFREQGLPRAVFLASGKAGWGAICRLISATHLAGERGRPVTTPELIAEHLGDDVLVLLGPSSTLGDAATLRRDDHARDVLNRWREIVPAGNLLVEVTSHRLPSHGPGSSAHAARMAGVARAAGLPVLLTNAVRYADRLDAPTVDVLDAARTLVPLGSAGLSRIGPGGFRGNAEGFLKSGKQMHDVADEICRHAGLGDREARDLLARTRQTADRCVLDPKRDLGLGEVHFPEFEVVGSGSRYGRRATYSTNERERSSTAERQRSSAGERQRSSTAEIADAELRARCESAIGRRYGNAPRQRIWKRLDDELEMIRELGYASYFLTVGDVVDLIREMEVRVAARGSGAGSLVNYLLGVSGVDPIRHGLLMERFLSPLRQDLPDIDVDVESARRLEVYDAILDKYGGERCVAVSMMDTYRVRHAVRDVGAALGMPPGETDAIAKAFPHIRARDARMALKDLPELRASGLGEERLDLMFRLVERLDGLPRHIAMHPCGVLLSDATLLDRTPVEASWSGYPMSQFDKDDVEDLGLLKLDVLGIRMQSAMAHALTEIKRVDDVEIDLDNEAEVPFDDDQTFEMISESKTLGVFQIESPGQRELVGKSGIESFSDIITDISLFRPGPVKSDMITPYLNAKQGWKMPSYLHDDLKPILSQTHGVVVFHEQVIEIIAQFAGVTRAEADEKRRALGDTEGMAETRLWFFPRCLGLGYTTRVAEQIWKILEAFASFGFCKAHAAAFALPTYQSAWLKAHWPAHFLSGVLTHDPGMYPKRLILDDARQFGITVLGLDVNRSEKAYVVEKLDDGYGIRLALAEVKGINEGEVERIIAARGGQGGELPVPYQSLTDFWHRAHVSRPVCERLVLAGGFDDLYGIGSPLVVRRRGTVTRRDLLLQVAELDRIARSVARSSTRGRGLSSKGLRPAARTPAQERADQAAERSSSDPLVREEAPAVERHALASAGVWAKAAAQSRATKSPRPVTSVQLTLELGDEPGEEASGLPEMNVEERMKAELEILGLDVSAHVVDDYAAFLDELGVVRSKDLLSQRSRSELLVAGVKVATQTPPIRSGRRVIFLTLDDSTGPVDATFFEDAQGPYAATVFHSWLLVVRGELRRTGRRGVSVRATGCWELPELYAEWRAGGVEAVRETMAQVPGGFESTGPKRVLVHTSGFRMSPYSDIKPAGEQTRDVARKLWHRSPGSAG